jgi:hypothetical protein
MTLSRSKRSSAKVLMLVLSRLKNSLKLMKLSAILCKQMLYDDEDSKKKFQAAFDQKRSAFTSHRTHKRPVESLQTEAAVENENPMFGQRRRVLGSESLAVLLSGEFLFFAQPNVLVPASRRIGSKLTSEA